MADRVSTRTRSKIMASVGSRDTGPEIVLRKALHRLGFRYRTHYRSLPGSPDIAFPRLRKVIFVHGCFWHGHRCRWGKLPKSKTDYWAAKFAANRNRDRRVLRAVRQLGWKALVVWQCEIRDLPRLLPQAVNVCWTMRETRSCANSSARNLQLGSTEIFLNVPSVA